MIEKEDKNEEREEDSEDNKEREDKKLNLSKKQNKQILWAVILMGGIIAIIILVPLLKHNFFDKFTYINLDWQKTQLGDLIFYSIKIPIADRGGQITGIYTMNFRNDPRKLEYINNEIDDNLVNFESDEIVYISLNAEMEACGDNAIALINFAGFLRDFAELEIESAVSDENSANENGLKYITCDNSLENTVININSGDESKINKINENCYEIIYNSCEIIPVTEKFMLTILEHYMSYFKRK